MSHLRTLNEGAEWEESYYRKLGNWQQRIKVVLGGGLAGDLTWLNKLKQLAHISHTTWGWK
jgi:hypothetical protein